MAILHKQTWNRSYLIPSLIAVAICYSLVYNYILSNALQDLDPDEACAAQPGDGMVASPHCAELQIFHDWHSAEVVHEETDDALLQKASTRESYVAESIMDKSSPDDPIEVDALIVANAEHNHRREEFDKLEQEVRTSMNEERVEHEKQFKARVEKEKAWEAEMESHDRNHAPKSAASEAEHQLLVQWQARIDMLHATIHHALHANADAQWATDLTSLKKRLEAQWSYHMQRYAGHQAKVFALRHAQLDKLEEGLHAPPNVKFSTPWEKLGSVTFEVKQLRVELEFAMSRHTLAKQQEEMQMQLFEDANAASSGTAPATKAEDKTTGKSMTKQLSERMTDLESGLADLVSNQFEHAPVIEATTPAPTGFLDKRLQWSSVTSLSRSIVVGGASGEHHSVSKNQLRHLQWAGSLPKVTCITPVSYSRHTKARMMYFIDNFKLQDYEGPRQLLLVYHYLDVDAAELVQKYADGISIKGVASRGAAQDFPSNQALRYAAWSADADVIARWDFEDWHDPSQLAMQVRAMAATSRPACILGQTQTPDESHITDAEEQAVIQDKSLVGARSWMKVYWKPFLRQETSAEEGMVPPPAAHVVQLNMHNPAVAQVLTEEVFHVNSHQVTIPDINAAPVESKVHEWTMQECLDLDNSNNSPVDEATIDKNLGHSVSEMFHKLLARRHDISQKLQLLCMETTMESDMQQHIFKRKHVEQMVSIRSELDKHIAGLVALFPDEKK